MAAAAAAAAVAASALDVAVAKALSCSEVETSCEDIDCLFNPLSDWEEATRISVLEKSLVLLSKSKDKIGAHCRLTQLRNDSGNHELVPETSSVVTIPSVVALPPAGNYVSSVQSTRVDDDKVLRHLPYFGDNDAEGVDLEMYDNRATLAVLESAAGSDDFLVETLARHAVMKSSPLTQDPRTQAKIEKILGFASEKLGHTLEWMKNRFEEAADSYKRRRQLELEAVGPRIIRQSTFSALLCRRCFLYDCRMHGAMHAIAPLHINDKHKELRMLLQKQRQQTDDALKKTPNAGFRLKQFDVSAPTGADSEVLVASRNSDFLYAPDTLEHILMIAEGNDAATTSLGDLFEKDLPLIKQIVDKKIIRDIATCDAGADSLDADSGSSIRGKSAGRSKKRRRGWDRRKIAQSTKRDESGKVMFYGEYVPCNHVDCCSEHEQSAATEVAHNRDASTSIRECCIDSGFRCEKFCICPANCPNRWPGCNCVVGQCRTALCPCVQAGRECDPDVCRCGVRVSIESVRTQGSAQTRLQLLSDSGCECRNCVIQLGLGTRLYIGPSEINGWGLFVNERVEKGVFLKEYIGEAISQNEADRRGKVYDRHDTSYLFNVNMHNVLDAMRVGNKSRYANHSKDPNAYAKVVFVNGNQKIGLYAKRLLLPGTEILYNYMHECMDVVPEWQKIMEEAKASRKHVHSIPRGTERMKSPASKSACSRP